MLASGCFCFCFLFVCLFVFCFCLFDFVLFDLFFVVVLFILLAEPDTLFDLQNMLDELG